MALSDDARSGIVGYYRVLNRPVPGPDRLRLRGLDRRLSYRVSVWPAGSDGLARANEGMQGISWNILGQTYVPKHVTEHSFSWHATFPPDTFVPPHIHPDQDEYLYILEGKLDLDFHDRTVTLNPGELIVVPKGTEHRPAARHGAAAPRPSRAHRGRHQTRPPGAHLRAA